MTDTTEKQSQPEINIRPLSLWDTNVTGFYQKLMGQFTKVDFYPKCRAELNTDGRYTYVGIDVALNLVVTGSVFFLLKPYRYGAVAQIEDVVVDKDCRGQGYGKQMIQFLIAKAKDYGAYKVVLNCNDQNAGFYEKLGFRRHESQMRIDL